MTAIRSPRESPPRKENIERVRQSVKRCQKIGVLTTWHPPPFRYFLDSLNTGSKVVQPVNPAPQPEPSNARQNRETKYSRARYGQGDTAHKSTERSWRHLPEPLGPLSIINQSHLKIHLYASSHWIPRRRRCFSKFLCAASRSESEMYSFWCAISSMSFSASGFSSTSAIQTAKRSKNSEEAEPVTSLRMKRPQNGQKLYTQWKQIAKSNGELGNSFCRNSIDLGSSIIMVELREFLS